MIPFYLKERLVEVIEKHNPLTVVRDDSDDDSLIAEALIQILKALRAEGDGGRK